MAIERKYGRGALFAGKEENARGWADDKLETALAEFKRGAITKLSVIMAPEGRTGTIGLTMESSPHGITVSMLFIARPDDNF